MTRRRSSASRRSSLVLTVAAGLCSAPSAALATSAVDRPPTADPQLRGQHNRKAAATTVDPSPPPSQLIAVNKDDDQSFLDPFFGIDLDALGDIAVPIDEQHLPPPPPDHRNLVDRDLVRLNDDADDDRKDLNDQNHDRHLQEESTGSKQGGHYRENFDLQLLDLTNNDEEQTGERGDGGAGEGPTPYIVNGVRTRVPSFVMTLDDRDGSSFRGVCGATMISNRWAVTAAHCISNYYANDLKSKFDAGYVGAYSPWVDKNEGRNYQVLAVQRFVCHPDHKPGAGSPHDICLVEFSAEVDTSAFTDFEPMPICNYELTDDDNGRRGEAIGMGSTRYGGPKATELMKADVGYVKRSTCQQTFKPVNIDVTEEMLCFGGQGKDSCG